MTELREDKSKQPRRVSKVIPTYFKDTGIKHQHTILQAFNIWIDYKMWSNLINAGILFQVIKNACNYDKIY